MTDADKVIAIRASAGEVDEWDASADSMDMSRNRWILTVLNVASGRSTLSEALHTVKRFRDKANKGAKS